MKGVALYGLVKNTIFLRLNLCHKQILVIYARLVMGADCHTANYGLGCLTKIIPRPEISCQAIDASPDKQLIIISGFIQACAAVLGAVWSNMSNAAFVFL